MGSCIGAACGLAFAMAWPATALAQRLPGSGSSIYGPASLRDPSEPLRRDLQQERERAQSPKRSDALANAVPVDDRFAPFPRNLDTPGESTIAVQRIAWTADADNSLADPSDFARIAAIFEGRALNSAHIAALLDRLNLSLAASGYVTSRVVVAGQTATGAQLLMRVQAGRIEEVRYNGHDIAGHEARLTGVRLAVPLEKGAVLRLQDIEQFVEQINRLRRNSAQAQIKPGAQPDTSIVDITNRATGPRGYVLSLDNQGSAATGRTRVQAGIEVGNALGLMESLWLGLVASADVRALFGTFSLPVGYSTLNVTRMWSEYQSHSVATDDSMVLDQGTFGSTSIALNRLLRRDQDGKLAMDLSLARRHSERSINGFPLTPQNQTVARLGLNAARRFDGARGLGQWALGMGVVQGLPALGADRDAVDMPGGTARNQFTKLDGNASLQVPVAKSWNWRSSVAAQWSRVPLNASDQLYLGGIGTLRGFAESAVGGDRGIGLRNEWAMQDATASLRGALGGLLGQSTLGIEPYVFMDGARLRTLADGSQATLVAVGLGLRFSWGDSQGEIVVGKPVKATDAAVDGGPRLNFQWSWQF